MGLFGLGKEKKYDDPPLLLFLNGADRGRGENAFAGQMRPPRIGEVLGLDMYAMTKISDLIQLVTNAKEVKKLGWERSHALLLAGPPGTGKTLAADAIARACEENAIIRSINPEVLLDPEQGKLAQNIQLLFAQIRSLANTIKDNSEESGLRKFFRRDGNEPILVVKLDEFDQLALDKAAQSGVALNYDQYAGVNMMLRGMDDLRKKGVTNVVFLFTTNYLKFIEPAIVDRLSVVRFFQPDPETRKQIMIKTLSDVMYELDDNRDIFTDELLKAIREYRKASDKLDHALKHGSEDDIKRAKIEIGVSFTKTLGGKLDHAVDAADGMTGRQIDEAIRSLIDSWIARKTRRDKSRKIDTGALMTAIDMQRLHTAQQESTSDRRFDALRIGV